MSVLFKGGTIVNSTGRYTADVFADGDQITAIGANLDNPADEVVDAKGKYILPGAIDPHTHISMPFMGTSAHDFLRSMASRRVSPFCCRSKSTTQVTPPQAAAMVPVS